MDAVSAPGAPFCSPAQTAFWLTKPQLPPPPTHWTAFAVTSACPVNAHTPTVCAEAGTARAPRAAADTRPATSLLGLLLINYSPLGSRVRTPCPDAYTEGMRETPEMCRAIFSRLSE